MDVQRAIDFARTYPKSVLSLGGRFGYKDQGGQRLIYAYDMARVLAEFSRLEKAPRRG